MFWINISYLLLQISLLLQTFLKVFILFVIICFLMRLALYLYDSVDRTKQHVAFFHPYCNAGGGGERVLWCSIQAIQTRYPQTVCYVYTGDLDAAPHEIMENVRRRFDIHLKTQPIFIYLKLRWLVEAKNYPFMTLVMQSLSSMILGLEALARFYPDVFIDTMGYAFTYPVFRFIGGCNISSYTHYPTISSDMLDRVSDRTEAHNNRAFISRSFILSFIKLCYYRIFAFMYGLVGSISSVVMVNSSWTKGHITQLWRYEGDVPVVFPPCDTAKFSSLPLINDEEKDLKTIVSIGQFRPEKDYPLQLRSFKRLLEIVGSETASALRLVLIGGVRNSEDQRRVEDLKALAKDLDIADKIIWRVNAEFSELLQEVQKGTIGIHTMWNEHFGIGVVECMAGGLIMVAHDSGGPQMDIVTPYEGEVTGFLASNEETYANKIKEILNLSTEDRKSIRTAARCSASRFSNKIFKDKFLTAMRSLLDEGRNE